MPFRKIFKYYWMEMRKGKALVLGALLAMAVGQILDGTIQPLIYKKIIDVISAGAQTKEAEELLWKYFFFLFLTIVTASAAFRLRGYCNNASEVRVKKGLFDFALSDLSKRSYRFFTGSFTGSLVAKTKRFVNAYETLYDVILFNLFAPALQVVGTIVVLFFVSPIFGYLFLGWFVLYAATIAWLARWKFKYNLLAATEDSRATGVFSDVLTNILNVKMFASGKAEESSFAAVTDDQMRANRRASMSGLMQITVQGVFTGAPELASIYLAIRLWLAGEISPGTIALLQIYIVTIAGDMWGLGRSLIRFTRTVSDAAEMVEIFEQPIEVLDPALPETCRIKRGEVEFENVTFAYHEGGRHVLSDFSLTVRAGEKVGLVGSSGAGKTTITKLLLRFADPQTGAITIDGQNIAAITQDDLRRNIAYVPQDPVLFHRTLRENIAYGKQDASEEEIIAAAKKAHAHEFISRFPHGYDTLVGERGVKLSGGERQRIAIARAILKNAPILILDEATSSLDAVSERYIQEGLEELMRGKTVVVVAHRLSTVRKMNRIIVLGEKGIEEEGTHDDLLVRDGQYAAFWNHQTDGLLA